MHKNDTILQYLCRFTQVHDDLASFGNTVSEDDLVSLSLLGLPNIWHIYQDSVNKREKLLNWQCISSKLVQEKIRWNTRDGTSSKGEDEEKFPFVGKGKKGK